MQKWLTHPALFALVTLGNCACGCQDCDPPEVYPAVTLRAVDAQGNDVPIEQAVLTQDGVERPCRAHSYDGGYDCTQQEEGSATLTVIAAGQTLTRAVRPKFTKQTYDCVYPETEQVELLLDGAGCPPPTGVAIVGSLVDIFGKDSSGTVEIELQGKKAICDVQGASFSCPSLSAYTGTYNLRVELGTSVIERSVPVQVSSCELAVSDATIDLSKRVCPEGAWSIIGSVVARPGAPISVRQSLRGAAGKECIIVPRTRQGGPAFVDYFCDALTPTGGGDYTLEVADGRATRVHQLSVRDDGCKPRTQRIDIDFLRMPDPA